MKNLTIIIFLLFAVTCLSQEVLSPIKEITYGNKNHTNRDFLRCTLKDSENNLYLIGETENDLTFNDVKIIKLDKDLNVLWEKEKSFEFQLSYDGVMGAHIDSNDNLIVIARAAYTSFKQTFFVLKYDKYGNLKWEYEITDSSNSTLNIPFYSYSSYIDDTDNVHVKYSILINNDTEYFFLTLSPSGQNISEFSIPDLLIGENGSRRFKLLNNNGVYNMVTVEDLYVAPYQKFMLHKFTSSTQESFNLNLDTEATGYFNSPFAESWTIMKKDNNDNLIIVAPSYSIHKDYGILNINPDGTLKYKIFPDDINDKYPIEFGFDNQNNLIIVSNNRTSNTSNNLKFTIQKYNQNGDLFFESSIQHTGVFATINNNKIYVLTDNNQIINFDFDFNILNQIQLNNINTNKFTPNDIINIDSNFYLSGQTEDPPYNGNVFNSEIDMLIKKTDGNNEIKSYTFSGLGTSKVFFENELVVRDTAYAFAITEKIGPISNYPGSVSKEQQHFVTIDKDLNVLEDLSVETNDILYTTYYPKSLETKFEASNGDEFKYIIKSDTTQVSLYKNDLLEWSRDLDLYVDPNSDGIIDESEIIFDWKVNKKGDFLLTSHIYQTQQCTLHKYSLENDYNSLQFDKLMLTVMPLTNNWLFTINDSGYITIYSDRLTIINEIANPIDSNLYAFSFFIKEKNNQILFNKYGDNIIKTFNQFGELQTNYFSIPENLTYPLKEYDNNFLIIMKKIGASIAQSPEYGWSRERIIKYDLDMTNTFPDISYGDDDGDGISNDIDECRNTSSNDQANQYGCSQSQVLNNIDYLIGNNIVSIYPNPITDNINYNILSTSLLKSIEIYDYLGRLIFKSQNNLQKNTPIEFVGQSKGLYFLKFNFENNNSVVKKIIKD